MCVTALVLAGASLAASAAGAVTSIQSAKNNASAQQQMLTLQQQQMASDMETQRLKAREAEVARLDDFRRQRAANIVAIAGSGVGENLSFLQGIMPSEQRALGMDLGNIRLGLLGAENRVASEIRVNRLNSQVVKANKQAQIIGSAIKFVGDAAQAGSYYQTYKTPGADSFTTKVAV